MSRKIWGRKISKFGNNFRKILSNLQLNLKKVLNRYDTF